MTNEEEQSWEAMGTFANTMKEKEMHPLAALAGACYFVGTMWRTINENNAGAINEEHVTNAIRRGYEETQGFINASTD